LSNLRSTSLGRWHGILRNSIRQLAVEIRVRIFGLCLQDRMQQRLSIPQQAVFFQIVSRPGSSVSEFCSPGSSVCRRLRTALRWHRAAVAALHAETQARDLAAGASPIKDHLVVGLPRSQGDMCSAHHSEQLDLQRLARCLGRAGELHRGILQLVQTPLPARLSQAD